MRPSGSRLVNPVLKSLKFRYTVSGMTRQLSVQSKAHLLATVVALLIVGTVAVVGFSVVYAGKVYPGVSADGVYLGGLSRTAALQELSTQASQYAHQKLTIDYTGGGTARLPVSSLALSYPTTGVTAALGYGRSGSLAQQIRTRIRSMLGRAANFADYHYSDTAVLPVVSQIDTAVTQPVANAALGYSNGQVTVTPSQPGRRLDDGTLIMDLDQHLATMSDTALTAPVYTLAPSITEATLAAARHQADSYVAAPLTITAGPTSQTVSQAQILSWVDVKTATAQTDLPLDPLQSFYPFIQSPTVSLALNQTKVGSYVATLAASLNQPAQDAVLGWQNNALTVVTPSKPGVAFDQTKATAQIVAALNQPDASHTVTLASTVAQAAVNENNLASLGINSLISSGNTTFPGSSAARITNVTVGAAKFNDVLLSPGQEFSFGQILGPVGAAQGYLPGLVILGNEETYQYGGGLCQVATTAFRAALLAGLPINERSNHSYAVSFYTAPYGVPGVDATIYYPEVDLKFTNDTGHYILIQTSISGDSLTFNFYGTKTKTGVIIPPHFVYGTTNAAQASETVFQRQILDLSGNVIKTDTFTQYYAPSTDFPIEQTSAGA
jgi:vancomycin resistance protein YoaR